MTFSLVIALIGMITMVFGLVRLLMTYDTWIPEPNERTMFATITIVGFVAVVVGIIGMVYRWF